MLTLTAVLEIYRSKGQASLLMLNRVKREETHRSWPAAIISLTASDDMEGV